MTKDIEVLIADVLQLVSLPEVYYRLEEIITDPVMSLEDAGEIIRSDTDLTARLLRIANSAFFGFPSQIESIGRALTLIGTQQLRDLVFATSVIKAFSKLPLGFVSMRSFWQHSIACGATARVIATWRREPNIERYYVAGLLHDIGRLVLYIKSPAMMTEIFSAREAQKELLFRLEEEVLGYNHAAVGGALLQAWGIPQALIEPVELHHTPEASHRCPVETAVVHVADVLVNGLRIGTSGEGFVPPLNEAAWNRLGISENALPEITGRAEQQFKDAMAIFMPDQKG